MNDDAANKTADSSEGLPSGLPHAVGTPPCCRRPSSIGGCPVVCTAQFIQQGCEVIGAPLSERSPCVSTLSSRLVGQGDSTERLPPAAPLASLRFPLSTSLAVRSPRSFTTATSAPLELGLALPACAWAPDSKRQTVASPSCFRSNCQLTT